MPNHTKNWRGDTKSSEREAILDEALPDAERLSQEVRKFYEDWVFGPDKWKRRRDRWAESDRLKTWFGTERTKRGQLKKVRHRIGLIDNRLSKGLTVVVKPAQHRACACRDGMGFKTEPSLSPRKVKICPVFFDEDRSNLARASLFIHELVHGIFVINFHRKVNGKIADSEELAKDLAAKHPVRSRKNAYNWQFLYEEFGDEAGVT